MYPDALGQSGEFMLKHARHAALGSKFYAFRGIEATESLLENPQQHLQCFLESESLEEQRINFLANQARVQTSQAAVNAQLYEKEISREQELLALLDRQKASQELSNFFELSNSHIQRYIAVRERDQQESAAVRREQSEEVCRTVLESMVAGAEVVGEVPLLKPVAGQLGLFGSRQAVHKFGQFKDFRQFFSDSDIVSSIEDVCRISPVEKIDTEMGEILEEYSLYIRSYLEKQNYVHCETLTFDPSVWPMPEPVDNYDGYYKLERFESLKSLMDFIKLTSYFLQPIVKDAAFITKYYEEEPMDALVDLGLLESKEKFVQRLWYCFKKFEPPVMVEEVEDPKKKTKKKPSKEEEAPTVKDPEPDYTVEIPDYFNLVGTKVIFVCGCRRSGKTRFTERLEKDIRDTIGETDFTMRHPKAIQVFHDPESLTSLKQILFDAITENFLEAPRYLIIDSPPCFPVAELNAVARALIERQQEAFDQHLTSQLRLSLPSKYPATPVEQQPEQPKKEIRRSSSQKSGRSAPVVVQPIVDDKMRVEQSGLYRVYFLQQTYEEFLANQFGRIFLEEDSRELLSDTERAIPALLPAQLSRQLKLHVPLGENYAEEFRLHEEFRETLCAFYSRVYFGLVFQPAAKDSVVRCVTSDSAPLISTEQVGNLFLLDFPAMSQQRLNARFLFRITGQLGIKFNESLAQFLRQKEEFLQQLDAKKLKALQEKDQKKMRQEKPQERSVIDSAVIQKLKGLQEQVFKFQIQTEEFNKAYSLLAQQKMKTTAAAVHSYRKYLGQGLAQTREKFSTLLETEIQHNFDTLVQYQLQVSPELRTQDVLVADYTLMVQQVAQENLALLQRLYQSLSQDLRQAAADQLQLNKRLPWAVLQRIDAFVEAQFSAGGPAPSDAQTSQSVAQQPKAARSKSRGPQERPTAPASTTHTAQEPQLQKDAQFALVAFFQRAQHIRALAQAHQALKYQLLAICLTIQAAVYNVDFVYCEQQRSLLQGKSAKVLEAQIQQFDGATSFAAAVDGQLNGQDVSLDRLIEVLQQASSRVEKTPFLGIAPTGDTVPLQLNQQFTSIASEFDTQLSQIIKHELESLSQDVRQAAILTTQALQAQADELETHFATAGEAIAAATKELLAHAGKDAVLSIRINGTTVEVEVAEE